MSEIMEMRHYATAVLVLSATFEVFGQVATLCKPNELFLSCGGCQKTCQNPNPACAAVCRVGCYCPDDQVRGVNGICMPLSKCKNTSAIYMGYADTSEPVSKEERDCPDNEEYRFCEPCGNKTCENPNPICPAQCARGCFCKDDMVRDGRGICVELKQCGIRSNHVKREIVHKCGINEEFKQCQNCERTCSNQNPVCPAQCKKGCFCKDGYFKSPSGECVKPELCPKEPCEDMNAEYTCRYPCEEFCSWRPCVVRAARCSVGCFCKAGFIKEDSSGECVLPGSCLTPKGIYD